MFTVGESILSRMSLSNGHAILVPTAWPIEVTVVVGLHTYASLSDANFTTTAAASGPIGIRPILYVGSVEHNSPSATTISSFEYQSSS